MQEIAPNVFLETNAIGLITGVIHTEAGSILIDAPCRQDDTRAWRAGAARMAISEPRFLISLDNHYDRVLGCKSAECTIISHTNAVAGSKSKTSTPRPSEENSIEGEAHEQPVGPMRWVPPEVLFEKSMALTVGGTRLELEHHPGSNTAGVWVILPQQKVVFVGDTVLVDQPPFLAYADLAAWQQDLALLTTRGFKGFQIVSARSGVVGTPQVRDMARLIAAIATIQTKLLENGASLEDYLDAIPKIMKRINSAPEAEEQYVNRLRWGISTWYEQTQK